MVTVIDHPACFAIVVSESRLQAPLRNAVKQRVQSLLARGERRIVIDLAGLTDIDAAGVTQLVPVYNLTIAAGGVLRIAFARRHVRQLLRIAGVLRFLER